MDTEASGKIVRNYSQVLAYVLIALVSMIGFLRMGSIINRVDEEQKIRARSLCESGNDNKAVLLNLIKQSSQPIEPPPGSDPALVAAIEQNKERAEEFQAFADKELAPRDCTKLVEDT